MLLIIGIQWSSHKDELIVIGTATGFCSTNIGVLVNPVSQNSEKGKMHNAFVIILVALSHLFTYISDRRLVLLCLGLGKNWVLGLQFYKYDDWQNCPHINFWFCTFKVLIPFLYANISYWEVSDTLSMPLCQWQGSQHSGF